MLSYFGLGHLNFLTFIIVLTALTIASVTDIKSKTIPILLFPLTMCVSCILVFPTWERLIGFFILGLAFFLFASFGNGGGGDVFMMATIGLQMGISKGLWCATISYIIYAIFDICYICSYLLSSSATKKKKKGKTKTISLCSVCSFRVYSNVCISRVSLHIEKEVSHKNG